MLLRQQQQVQPVSPQVISQSDNKLESFGSPILPTGQVTLADLPPEAVELIDRIDVSTLPLTTDYKQVVTAIQQKNMERVILKGGIDPDSVQIQKITNIAQLTPEQQSLLLTSLKNIKNKQNTDSVDAAESKSFSSEQALFAHVANKLSSLDASELEEMSAGVTAQHVQHKPLLSPNQPTADAVESKHGDIVNLRPTKSMTRCPHCNMSLDLDPLEITDEQKTNFLYSVIHNSPYTETNHYFNGNISVTFRSLNAYEQDFLANITAAVSERKDISEKDKYEFYTRSYMALSVVKLSVVNNVSEFPSISTDCSPDAGVDLVLARCNEIIGKLYGGEMLNLLCAEALKFSFRYRKLVSMGFNPDFWPPIQ